MSIESFIENLPELEKREELIFFGGSFNPWHAGHSNCLRLMDPHKTIIVVPDHNPFKELVKNNKKESTLDDIKIKLRDFDQSLFLFTEFFEENKKNPTHQWIAKLRARFPQKKLSLLVGFDTFMGMDKWIKAQDLLNHLNTIYVASRMDDEELKSKQIKKLQSMAPIHIHFLGRHDAESISSTQIRKSR